MATPSIAKLGHIGMYVNDLEKEKAFYRDVLGLQVTDEDSKLGAVFMSARPKQEHHELALFGGRNVGPEAHMLQQVSFRCDSMDDVIGYYKRFQERRVRFDLTVTHGNALSIYCYDPEGNRCEIYWNTGLKARQPYVDKVDLNESPAEIMRRIKESVRRHGKTGYVDMEALAAWNVSPHN